MLLSVFQKSKMSPILAKGKRRKEDIPLRSRVGVGRMKIFQSKRIWSLIAKSHKLEAKALYTAFIPLNNKALQWKPS